MPERGDQLALGSEHPALDGVEGIEHLEHAPVLLPDRVADALERRAPVLEARPLLLDRLPRGLAARPRLPRARVAFDPRQRLRRVPAALLLDEGADIELAEPRQERASVARQRLPDVAPPPVMPPARFRTAGGRSSGGVAQNTRFTFPAFARTSEPCGQQRVDQHPVAAQPVHPDHDAQAGAGSPLAEQDHPARLDVVERPRPGRAGARARRPPARVHLRAQLPVAADPVELPARRLVSLGLGQRRLRLGHLALQVADLAEALVLTERGFDHAPDRRLVPHVLDQERDGAEPEAELADDRLRRARRPPRASPRGCPGRRAR